MQIKISKSTLPQPERAILRAGYALHLDRNTGERSYVRRLDRDLFPRFHVYVEPAGESWSLNLHLDQRAPMYVGVTAHSGEYDGAVVEREMARIAQHINTPAAQHLTN